LRASCRAPLRRGILAGKIRPAPGGTLLDPFVGSGTTLAAGLANGAFNVIGIDKEAKYLRTAARRIREG
jgi:DNA modification methylase